MRAFSPRRSASSLYNLYLIFNEAVEFIYQAVDLTRENKGLQPLVLPRPAYRRALPAGTHSLGYG